MEDIIRHDEVWAGSQLELTAVFGSHGSGKDALEASRVIEPDSIVYIEGARLEVYDGIDEFKYLALHKRKHGKDGDYYEHKGALAKGLKKELSKIRRKKMMRPLLNGRGYDLGEQEHEIVLHSELLTKDCEVINADFRFMRGDESEQQAEALSIEIAKIRDEHPLLIVGVMKKGDDINEVLSRLSKSVWRTAVVHNLRETMARTIILNDINRIVGNPQWFMNAPRSPSGKIKASVIYGTAHARSLSAKFAERGVEVKPLELKSLPESQYLDNLDLQKRGNYYRRVAHGALMGASFGLFGTDRNAWREVNEEMYDFLEILNDDKPLLIDFCKQCLVLRQKSQGDLNGARQDFNRLVQDFRDLHV